MFEVKMLTREHGSLTIKPGLYICGLFALITKIKLDSLQRLKKI